MKRIIYNLRLLYYINLHQIILIINTACAYLNLQSQPIILNAEVAVRILRECMEL